MADWLTEYEDAERRREAELRGDPPPRAYEEIVPEGDRGEMRSFDAPWYDDVTATVADWLHMIRPGGSPRRSYQLAENLAGPQNPFNFPAQITSGINTASEGYRMGDYGKMGDGALEMLLAVPMTGLAGWGAFRGAKYADKALGPNTPYLQPRVSSADAEFAMRDMRGPSPEQMDEIRRVSEYGTRMQGYRDNPAIGPEAVTTYSRASRSNEMKSRPNAEVEIVTTRAPSSMTEPTAGSSTGRPRQSMEPTGMERAAGRTEGLLRMRQNTPDRTGSSPSPLDEVPAWRAFADDTFLSPSRPDMSFDVFSDLRKVDDAIGTEMRRPGDFISTGGRKKPAGDVQSAAAIKLNQRVKNRIKQNAIRIMDDGGDLATASMDDLLKGYRGNRQSIDAKTVADYADQLSGIVAGKATPKERATLLRDLNKMGEDPSNKIVRRFAAPGTAAAGAAMAPDDSQAAPIQRVRQSIQSMFDEVGEVEPILTEAQDYDSIAKRLSEATGVTVRPERVKMVSDTVRRIGRPPTNDEWAMIWSGKDPVRSQRAAEQPRNDMGQFTMSARQKRELRRKMMRSK